MLPVLYFYGVESCGAANGDIIMSAKRTHQLSALTALPINYLIEPTVLGKSITSRILAIPVVYMISLSKPRPKPP